MSEIQRFPEQQLDFVESRVLGAILEKETITPDYDPMTSKGIKQIASQKN